MIAVVCLITVLAGVNKHTEKARILTIGNAREIFIQNCATCHGREGEGTLQAKGLKGRGLAPDYVKKMVQMGNSVMPQFHNIHDPMLSELASYVNTLK